MSLSLPETSERASWGHPNFVAGKKTFVTIEHFQKQLSIAFRLDAGEIERLLRDRRFFATPYGRGRWISVRMGDGLDWELVRDLVLRAYRVVAPRRMIAALDGERRELL